MIDVDERIGSEDDNTPNRLCAGKEGETIIWEIIHGGNDGIYVVEEIESEDVQTTCIAVFLETTGIRVKMQSVSKCELL